MSLPEIGAHCTVPSCNINDFLPIRCKCDNLFCKSHISAEAHSCPVITISGTALNELGAASSTLQKCAAEGCKKPSLEAFVSDSTRENTSSRRSAALCPRCKQAFCASHREPPSHSCKAEETSAPPKNEAARALLEKHFPGTRATASSDSSTALTTPASGPSSNTLPSASSSTKSLNPKKAAQLRQVQLMKMRHKAEAGDPKDIGKAVPLDQKLFVLVRTHDSTESKPFWFRKTTGTGKALDLLVDHFRVSRATPIHLVKATADSSVTLRNDLTLAEQVEDGAELTIQS
ncbi:hypothetical protein K474DRAFT_1663820 [Panus rudis PR-1116 ss-1]|nr:hypothetical protein K474DRAFT_1663820 [Panus rudis PR-1116 ss-1]